MSDDPRAMDRAPSHAKPPWPPAAHVAQRLANGDTMAQIAADYGRTAPTLRGRLNEHGYDSVTALPMPTVGRRQAPEPSPDRGWMADALCAQIDPALFFPEIGESYLAAKRICGECPVRSECLEDALLAERQWGIAGGLTERERQRLKTKRRNAS